MIKKSIQKSITSNKQLDFTSQISISYLDIITNHSSCEIVDFIKLLDIDSDQSQQFGLICTIDKRDKTFKSIVQNNKVAVSWYFPLSKEKYIMQTQSILYCKDGIQQHKKDENHDLSDTIPNIDKYLGTSLTELWSQLSQEQKKHYVRAHPGLDLQTMQEPFNTPDINNIPSNLTVLLLVPYHVEHTVYHMPQVVADSRTKFESIFMPYKKDRKYVHQMGDQQWTVKEVNP